MSGLSEYLRKKGDRCPAGTAVIYIILILYFIDYTVLDIINGFNLKSILAVFLAVISVAGVVTVIDLMYNYCVYKYKMKPLADIVSYIAFVPPFVLSLGIIAVNTDLSGSFTSLPRQYLMIVPVLTLPLLMKCIFKILWASVLLAGYKVTRSEMKAENVLIGSVLVSGLAGSGFIAVKICQLYVKVCTGHNVGIAEWFSDLVMQIRSAAGNGSWFIVRVFFTSAFTDEKLALMSLKTAAVCFSAMAVVVVFCKIICVISDKKRV